MKITSALEAAEALDEWRILYLANETLTRRLLSMLESYHDTGRLYFRPTRYATDRELRIWFCLFVAAAEGEI